MIQTALGCACRHFRMHKNISQEKFALLIGMDRTYYASIESGKRNVSLKNIEKIASGFDISISQLFIGVGNKKNKE